MRRSRPRERREGAGAVAVFPFDELCRVRLVGEVGRAWSRWGHGGGLPWRRSARLARGGQKGVLQSVECGSHALKCVCNRRPVGRPWLREKVKEHRNVAAVDVAEVTLWMSR